jgi:GntR family transcriptional regulator
MGVTLPRYARVAAEIKRRIEAGELAPGDLLPSEHQLAEAFGVSRPTVVRALSSLRHDGWIETRQGRGSLARGCPMLAGTVRRRPADRALELPETEAGGLLVQAGVKIAPAHVTAPLGLEAGAKAFLRQRLLSDDGTPAELASAWLPLETAAGTDLDSPELLGESVRYHLASRKGLRLSHATERTSARKPTAEEAELLGVADDAPVLNVTVTAHDATARPVLVADIVLRGGRDDAYPFA